MAQSSNNTISALEDRMDSVLCKLFDKIDAMETSKCFVFVAVQYYGELAS